MAVEDRVSLIATCFLDASFRELDAYWRALGVRRVSLVSPSFDREPLHVAREVLVEGGYEVETITHTFTNGAQLSRDEATWQEPRERLSAMIENAASVGARSIYMLTGGHGGMAWEDAATCFARAIAPCVEEARTAGVLLLVEDAVPHYAHIHLAHNLRDTITLAKIAGIGVNIDLFSCWTEAGLKETIASAMPLCGLVQIGDYILGDTALPGRAVPGDGAIPLQRLLGWILDAGYEGVFDIELIGPRIDEEGGTSAARRALDHTYEVLRSLGL